MWKMGAVLETTDNLILKKQKEGKTRLSDRRKPSRI